MSETQTQTVQTLIDRWVEFWNTYDLDQFDALFADEGATYFSSEYDGLIIGRDALRTHHAGFGFVPGGKSSANLLWLTGTTMRWAGEAVTVLAIWHFQRAGAATSQQGPVTFVVVPQQNGYRISHAHFANGRGTS
jgi:hypothetical protein